MQSQMIHERHQLGLELQSLDRSLCEVAQPVGLKQRAKFAFLKQLHAFKHERSEELRDALRHSRTVHYANGNRIRRI